MPYSFWAKILALNHPRKCEAAADAVRPRCAGVMVSIIEELG